MGLSSMLGLVSVSRAAFQVTSVGGACAMPVDTPTIIASVRKARTMIERIDRRRLVAGATATTALLAAPSLVRAQPQALKIAVLLPRSGYLAQAGQSCHRGAQIAGKVLADHGYRVELVHVDIESSPDISRTQTEKVINEGAHCIVGAFDSASTLAIAQVCEQRQ